MDRKKQISMEAAKRNMVLTSSSRDQVKSSTSRFLNEETSDPNRHYEPQSFGMHINSPKPPPLGLTTASPKQSPNAWNNTLNFNMGEKSKPGFSANMAILAQDHVIEEKSFQFEESEINYDEISDRNDEKNQVNLTQISLKIMNGNIITFTYETHQDRTIGNLKQKFFINEINLGSNIKWIHQGKIMKDEQKLKEFSLTKNPHILTFITPGKNQSPTSPKENTGSRPDLTGENNREETFPESTRDPNGNNDFEYFRDKYGFTDEEMNWKRFCYHGGYSLSAWVYQINDNNLVIRESEWIAGQDPELKTKPEKFKAIGFHDKN